MRSVLISQRITESGGKKWRFVGLVSLRERRIYPLVKPKVTRRETAQRCISQVGEMRVWYPNAFPDSISIIGVLNLDTALTRTFDRRELKLLMRLFCPSTFPGSTNISKLKRLPHPYGESIDDGDLPNPFSWQNLCPRIGRYVPEATQLKPQ